MSCCWLHFFTKEWPSSKRMVWFLQKRRKKKVSARRRLWEYKFKTGPKWKATKYHAICSKHFISWCNGPSPSHLDPELFGYNQWKTSKGSKASVGERRAQPNARVTDAEANFTPSPPAGTVPTAVSVIRVHGCRTRSSRWHRCWDRECYSRASIHYWYVYSDYSIWLICSLWLCVDSMAQNECDNNNEMLCERYFDFCQIKNFWVEALRGSWGGLPSQLGVS